MNQPPEFCPYCGTEVTSVDSPMIANSETPMIHRCDSCDGYVFYNPTPGGSAVVVENDSMLLVEDFRSPGEWKLPSGRMELGESAREGVARELEEETGLGVDPDDLTYFYEETGEPVEDQYMLNFDYAVSLSDTSGSLSAASDATDVRFFTPGGLINSKNRLKKSHIDRFGTDSLSWLLEEGKKAINNRN